MSHERAFENWQWQEEERRNPLGEERNSNVVPKFRAHGMAREDGNSYMATGDISKVLRPAKLTEEEQRFVDEELQKRQNNGEY